MFSKAASSKRGCPCKREPFAKMELRGQEQKLSGTYVSLSTASIGDGPCLSGRSDATTANRRKRDLLPGESSVSGCHSSANENPLCIKLQFTPMDT